MSLMGRKQLSHGIQTRKNNENQQLTLKIHVSVVCTCTFWFTGVVNNVICDAGLNVLPAHADMAYLVEY